MESQFKMAAYHLGKFGSINTKEAEDLYDITRLSAYIHLLRKKYGWKIKTGYTYIRKHWWSGKKTKIVEYYLIKEV